MRTLIEWTDEERAQVCDWVRRHGLDPEQIPDGALVGWGDGKWTAEVIIPEEDEEYAPPSYVGNEVRHVTRRVAFTETEPFPLRFTRSTESTPAQ